MWILRVATHLASAGDLVDQCTDDASMHYAGEALVVFGRNVTGFHNARSSFINGKVQTYGILHTANKAHLGIRLCGCHPGNIPGMIAVTFMGKTDIYGK